MEPETAYSDRDGNFFINSRAIPYHEDKDTMLLQVQVEGFEDYQREVSLARETVGLLIQCKPKSLSSNSLFEARMSELLPD
ncbi:MAG: hypothetical protein HUJ26_22590 [Planctomycetaceae bacterium]|nr:hypothetical protein [Planctomycetaceae bacterium]